MRNIFKRKKIIALDYKRMIPNEEYYNLNEDFDFYIKPFDSEYNTEQEMRNINYLFDANYNQAIHPENQSMFDSLFKRNFNRTFKDFENNEITSTLITLGQYRFRIQVDNKIIYKIDFSIYSIYNKNKPFLQIAVLFKAINNSILFNPFISELYIEGNQIIKNPNESNVALKVLKDIYKNQKADAIIRASIVLANEIIGYICVNNAPI